MLTQNSLDRGRTSEKKKGMKIPSLKEKFRIKSSLKLSTFGSGVYSSGTAIHNTLIEYSLLERSNHNHNPTQQELIKWYCRWSHVNFDRVRMILAKPHQQKGLSSCGEIERQMVVPIHSSASTCKKCWCIAYLFAKAEKKSIESSVTINLTEIEGVLTNKDAQPGDKVSCDQYMSPTKGRLIHTRGKGTSMKQLYGCTIFIDHVTNYIFNNHQVNLTAATTVESKHKHKSKFDEFGIQVKQYTADNHPFCSKVWVEHYAVQRQLSTSHSGVGAHH